MEALRSSPPLCALLSRSSPPLRRLLLLSRSLPISSIPPRAISVRCSSDRIVARPSSELRSGRVSGHTDDPKMCALRNLFTRPGIGIDAYIVPSEDSHQSEFIADCFQRRAYISDFTGSSGTAIVTADKAALWTDGRYFLQAEKELSRSWTLMRSGNPGVPTTAEWLNDILDPGCKIGIDPFLFSYDAAEDLKKCISANNHELVYLHDLNLVDEIWKESRPQPPKEPIRVHPIKYAGVDVSSKLSLLRSQLTKEGCTAVVISMLDEIAWLLNLRGNDVRNSPVFYAYLIVEKDSAKLFVDNDKVDEEVTAHLTCAGVELKQYELIISEIESMAKKGADLWLDTSKTNAAIVAAFESASARHLQSMTTKKTQPHPVGEPSSLYKSSPVTIAKAIKNEEELEGMRSSHLRDAAALAEFWAWLEEKVHTKLTEVDVANKLLEFRLKQSDFLDTSFDTISGYGSNGAIIHYRPCHESCSVVGDKSLFLLDSGAQYVDGTTDVTRTVHFGEPTMRQKECFTRVLQGHISLDQAIFPENTPGFVLDVLARSSLWKIGLDYRHGTGHGVGAALNVHEGPQGISARYGNTTPLQKGMIVSNEPGYYEDHSFGIRIENLLIVKEVNTPNRFGGVTYLGFEKLTFVPIQHKLIDVALLSKAEISWINDYHSQVWEKVCPLVHGSALEWLRENTRPLVE